jgi:PAS domain S-box-containing protein
LTNAAQNLAAQEAADRERSASEALARAISAGETEFRELADNAPVLMYRVGLDKVCDYFNRAWLEFVGCTLQQEVGYGWADRVHPDDIDRCVAQYVKAFDARQRFSMEYRLRRHDGEYRWLVDKGAPFERNGQFAGYFGSCIDITDMREAQAHQEVLLAELNHRVKNNLQLIISFLSFSAARAETEEARTLLHAAIGRIHGVAAIQDQLHQHPAGVVDLAKYLPALARAALESDAAAPLTVQVEPVVVTFQQASNLGLIINELVINAIKHGGARERSVKMALTAIDDDCAQVVFRDSGPGFSEAVLNNPNRSTRRGAGLIDALSLRAHATLVRENDGGAKVTLTFPIERPED